MKSVFTSSRNELSGRPVRKEFGAGRVVYFPTVLFDGELPEMGDFFQIGRKFWKAPRNWVDIATGVRWAARNGIRIQVGGPPLLVANLVAQPEQRRLMLHLVNFNRPAVAQIRPVKVVCRPPAALREIVLLSPDGNVPGATQVRASAAGGAAFTVPAVVVYALAVMKW